MTKMSEVINYASCSSRRRPALESPSPEVRQGSPDASALSERSKTPGVMANRERRAAWAEQTARESDAPHRFIRDYLSEAAQKRLAELVEQLNPLAKMVAKAKGRRDAKLSGRPAAAVTSGRDDANAIAALPEKLQPIESDRSHRKRSSHRNGRDLRLPPPGSMIRRYYKGRDLVVRILDSGFEFEGRRYRSLSAIAKEVTGAHWNGLLFFGLIHQEK